MASQESEVQLGDFIKGRLLFVEDYCRKNGLDHGQVMERIRKEAVRLAGSPERAEIMEKKFLSGPVLSSSYLPYWVDQVFLEAMTVAIKGPGAPLSTRSSRTPCLTFEAGRFNAHRQADGIFKLLFERRTPEDWLKASFVTINRKCYGDAFANKFRVEEIAPRHYRIGMDNTGMEKAHPMDCATEMGYLFGALEKLGARDPVVTHERCNAGPGSTSKICTFEASWS